MHFLANVLNVPTLYTYLVWMVICVVIQSFMIFIQGMLTNFAFSQKDRVIDDFQSLYNFILMRDLVGSSWINSNQFVHLLHDFTQFAIFIHVFFVSKFFSHFHKVDLVPIFIPIYLKFSISLLSPFSTF